MGCKNCKPPKRHPGCHDTCEEYQVYRAELDTKNETIRKKKTADAEIVGVFAGTRKRFENNRKKARNE